MKRPDARRRIGIGALILLGLCAGVFSLYQAVRQVPEHGRDSRFSPREWIDLSEPKAGSASSSPTAARSLPVRVAVAPVISPEKSIGIYRGLVDYLAARLSRQPVFLQRSTYAEVNDLVRYGRCDLAFVCTYAFVRGEREFGMESIVVPQVRGAVTYRSLILVPGSSRNSSLLDLRGERFASADVMSNTGWISPALYILERGYDPDHFFSEHVITGSHDRSVDAVMSGYVDGAGVDSLVYDRMRQMDPSVARRTKVIQESPPYGIPPLVVNPRLDPSLKKALQAALLVMHEDAEGRQVLVQIGIDRFVVPDRAMYDSAREAAQAWESR